MLKNNNILNDDNIKIVMMSFDCNGGTCSRVVCTYFINEILLGRKTDVWVEWRQIDFSFTAIKHKLINIKSHLSSIELESVLIF